VADTKISALTAAAAAADANELAINEAGTSKKVTAAQIRKLIGLYKKRVTADVSSTSATLAKVTDLDLTLPAGSYGFQYNCIWQSSSLTCGVSFNVNFTGTQTHFPWTWRWVDVSSTAATGAPTGSDGTIGQVYGAFASRIARTTTQFGPLLSVDTINADLLVIVEGSVVVTVQGNLELYFGSEVGADGTQKLIAGSGLKVWEFP
jgi:hypothetical protein